MPEPEVWLRGPLVDVAPLLQPAAHSLVQSREEVEQLLPPLTPPQIWRAPHGAATVGFHVRHAIGSLDRLLTYARGAVLSDAQLQVLAQEAQPDPDLSAGPLLAAFQAGVARALDQLRETDERTLTEVRLVGRGKLPSTVIGLLFHAAEHTQRHVGQAMSTARLVRGGP